MAAPRPMHGTTMTWLLTVSNAAVTQRHPPARLVVPRQDQNRHARRRTPAASLSLGPAQRRGARLGPALHAQTRTWSIFPTCASALRQAAAIPPHLPYPNGHQRLRRLPIAVSSSTITLRTCTLGPMPPSAPRARNYSGTSKHLFRTPTLLFEVSPPSFDPALCHRSGPSQHMYLHVLRTANVDSSDGSLNMAIIRLAGSPYDTGRASLPSAPLSPPPGGAFWTHLWRPQDPPLLLLQTTDFASLRPPFARVNPDLQWMAFLHGPRAGSHVTPPGPSLAARPLPRPPTPTSRLHPIG